MHTVYALVRLLPYWAFPLALICGELGWVYHRKGRKIQWLFWTLCLFLAISLILWFVYGGYLHSDKWVREFFHNTGYGH